MFKRGGVVSRSLHAPHGINIHGESKQNSKLKRKFSWSSPKVRSAISVGVLTHKPVVLKEGYLYKPGLFRIVSCPTSRPIRKPHCFAIQFCNLWLLKQWNCLCNIIGWMHTYCKLYQHDSKYIYPCKANNYLFTGSLPPQGGRRRRWCVLRTYTQTEASIDIYTDETKNKYKGSIALDKVSAPILVVKNYDPKKKKAHKNCYLLLKTEVKKNFQFTTDSFRDLKEWTALIRQVIDNGT